MSDYEDYETCDTCGHPPEVRIDGIGFVTCPECGKGRPRDDVDTEDA